MANAERRKWRSFGWLSEAALAAAFAFLFSEYPKRIAAIVRRKLRGMSAAEQRRLAIYGAMFPIAVLLFVIFPANSYYAPARNMFALFLIAYFPAVALLLFKRTSKNAYRLSVSLCSATFSAFVLFFFFPFFLQSFILPTAELAYFFVGKLSYVDDIIIAVLDMTLLLASWYSANRIIYCVLVGPRF